MRRQSDFIQSLEDKFPGISEVSRDGDGAILISQSEMEALGF